MIVVIIEGGNRMTNTQDINQLVALESCIKITKVEEVRINNKKVKLIYALNSKTRVGCPKCNKYTYWIYVKFLDTFFRQPLQPDNSR